MSRNAEAVLPFAGEDRRFRFGIAEHRRLQETLDCGVSEIVSALHGYVSARRVGASLADIVGAGLLGRIRPDEIRELIFQGLVGGGMEPGAAGALCKRWVLDRPPLENAETAYAVGIAALAGASDEEAGAPEGEPMGGSAPLPRGKLRFGRGGFYDLGARAGFTPQAVDAMSLWQFQAAIGGFAAFHGAGSDRLNEEDAAWLGELVLTGDSAASIH
ncbi:MAG: hypothetical protein WDM92_06400 [Caulobacteraceae bacterium]